MKQTIIMLALPRWDGKYASTSFAIATTLAKRHRVIYVDNPFTWKDFFTKLRTLQIRRRIWALLLGIRSQWTWPGMPDNLTIVTPPLVIPVNFIPEGSVYNILSRLNDRIVSRAINRCINRSGISQYIYINSFNPFYRYRPSRIKPDLFIYQCVDNIAEHAYVRRHGPRLEEQMIADADVVLVTSRELRQLKQHAGDKVHYLPNAADVHVFTSPVSAIRPPDIPNGFKGIIGYIGNIDRRLDYPLLGKVAERFPEHLLLFVGPKTFDDYKVSGLDKRLNVCFVDAKAYHELPSYLSVFGCALIPFKCNAATRSIYPLKVNEYLAAGKPVVSTDFSDDIRSFKDVIAIASDHGAFLDLIARELNADSPEKIAQRVAAAGQNTWEARVNTMWKIIDTHTLRKQ